MHVTLVCVCVYMLARVCVCMCICMRICRCVCALALAVYRLLRIRACESVFLGANKCVCAFVCVYLIACCFLFANVSAVLHHEGTNVITRHQHLLSPFGKWWFSHWQLQIKTSRVGQNCMYAWYRSICMVICLLKYRCTPYVRINVWL